MSESLLETARRIMGAWAQGVEAVLERFDELCTEDYEWIPPVTKLTGARYVGREGFERYVADVRDALGDIRIELRGEPEPLAPDAVRMRAMVHAEGAQSGLNLDAPLVAIVRFRDGRACWGWGSYDPAEAERVAEAIARGEEVRV